MLKTFKILLLILMIFSMVLSIVPRVYAGYWETTIDVLVAEDEEFRDWAGFLYGYYRWLWYLDVDEAFADFQNTFGITFQIRGIIEWDSNDNVNDAYYLLEEAISETGFAPGQTVVNGYVIDLLMVFSTWPQCDMIGFSFPDWKALIVNNFAFNAVPLCDLFQHELSHQFYVTHCNDLNCVMYSSLMPYDRTWGCQQHYDDINASKSRFWRWVETGGGGGGECPTLFVWNGTDYVSEGVLPIHAESDITVQHTIQNTLTLENGVYRLELRELDNYTSHLDQVRLYAVDDQGEWHLSPLLYADHSELGWVTWKLRFDDDNRVDMTPTQTIALRFLPSIPYSETAYFVFEINGCNRKALY